MVRTLLPQLCAQGCIPANCLSAVFDVRCCAVSSVLPAHAGTPNYASLNSLLRTPQTPRDDLEALVYCLFVSAQASVLLGSAAVYIACALGGALASGIERAPPHTQHLQVLPECGLHTQYLQTSNGVLLVAISFTASLCMMCLQELEQDDCRVPWNLTTNAEAAAGWSDEQLARMNKSKWAAWHEACHEVSPAAAWYAMCQQEAIDMVCTCLWRVGLRSLFSQGYYGMVAACTVPPV